MFRLRELTRERTKWLRRRLGDGVPFDVFPRYYLAIIKDWSRPKLSLTCRQGDFVEDLSEEEMQTQVAERN
jgi:hypothetical protein